MKRSRKLHWQAFMLPGIKRWIGLMLIFIFVMVYGVLLLMGFHPTYWAKEFINDFLHDAATVLPHRVTGLVVLGLGAVGVLIAVASLVRSVLRAYVSDDDRESIPDVLYRKRHLERGPRVVVVGGGTGLSNLLKGLKVFTNNITAIVTVGDDGGSSGRLREELGMLPPGDIRNCITALADEDKLVTELFRYRFESGGGLEGHSFGNLFLTAVFAITHGDMLEAVRVASRVLNSCGQVLPASLSHIALVAEMIDGQTIKGESKIPQANGRVAKLSIEPSDAQATPAALEAIANAELIVLGPGSLYTSIIPNLMVQGIADAIMRSPAHKIYVCNVMTQIGETTDYSVGDHVEAVLVHAGAFGEIAGRLIHAVLVNSQVPNAQIKPTTGGEVPKAVTYDPDKLAVLGVLPEPHPLLTNASTLHHDPDKLARSIMLWFYRKRKNKIAAPDDTKPPTDEQPGTPLARVESLESIEVLSKSAVPVLFNEFCRRLIGSILSGFIPDRMRL
jgi:uncharacterized cofD-like protein